VAPPATRVAPKRANASAIRSPSLIGPSLGRTPDLDGTTRGAAILVFMSATDRTRVRRHPERGAYEREPIDAILDEALICHVGFVIDGQPFVIPTIHARVDDVLYLHGSPASRMLRALRDGVDVCVTATLLDGVVLARSVYNHSMNYRSAVVLGRAREITDAEEKLRALEAVVEHIVPGRWSDARQPTQGQDTALTIRNTLLGGRAAGVCTACGVSAGQTVWTVCTSVGIGALLVASEPAFLALKLAGATYLIYLGVQALLHRGKAAALT